MLEITSRDNSRLKFARAVRDGHEREFIFIEGARLAEEAARANLDIVDYFVTAEFAADLRGANLIIELPAERGAIVSQKLLASTADTKTPSGVILLTRRPETGTAVLEKVLTRDANPLIVILHEINNPANAGAILRTAEAAGASGAILTRASVDVFSPKALRGAMGSAFRLPVWTGADFAEVVDFCRQNQIKTVCAALTAITKSHFEIDWTNGARALIIGSEARGLSADEIALCDERLKIPMNETVESLNAAVACGVILYEAKRQRESKR